MKDFYNGKKYVINGNAYSEVELRRYLKQCGYTIEETNQYLHELQEDHYKANTKGKDEIK